MGYCVNPTRSNHFQACLKSNIEPRNVFWGGRSLPPPLFIHFDLSFSLDWNNLAYNVFLLLNCKKGHTKGINGLLCESNQVQQFPSMPKVQYRTQKCILRKGWACPPLFSYILTLLFLLIGTILYIMCFCCWFAKKKDIEKVFNGLLCESNQIQPFPSMTKV